jgi:hypothetical protein
VRIGATLAGSLLAVLDRPATWSLALAAFLIRGGWLLMVAPIVVLPTAVGLANVVAPLLEDVAFGRRTGELITLVALVLGGALVWLVGGGVVAAAAEVEAVRRLALDPDVADRANVPARDTLRTAWRVAVLRLVVHIPFAVALVWGAARLAAVGYAELTVPSDVTVPAAWRIVAGAPDAVIGVVLTWLVGETVGALAARRVVLVGESARAALRRALGGFLRSPVRPSLLTVAATLVLFGVIAVTGLAAAAALEQLRAGFASGETSIGTTALLVVFVALFSGGLVLVGLTSAWRIAIWTVDTVPGMDGTFGGVGGSRSGD